MRVPRYFDPVRGNGQVLLQQLPRPEDNIRQRNGTLVRGVGCRPLRGYGPAMQGPAAQYFARLPQARIRIRRLMPAERLASHPVSPQNTGRGAADASDPASF